MTAEQVKMVEELCDKEEGLRGREVDFVDDLSNNESMELSQKQADWLQRIYDRVILK